MTERWLEDKTGLLSNYYFMLLQVCVHTHTLSLCMFSACEREKSLCKFYLPRPSPPPPLPLPSPQAELSRFYETILLQRDYYHAMEGALPLCMLSVHIVTHSCSCGCVFGERETRVFRLASYTCTPVMVTISQVVAHLIQLAHTSLHPCPLPSHADPTPPEPLPSTKVPLIEVS